MLTHGWKAFACTEMRTEWQAVCNAGESLVSPQNEAGEISPGTLGI